MKKEQNNDIKINKVGGMALLDGVMMKSEKKAVCAIRKLDGSIEVSDLEVHSVFLNSKIKKIPIIRGVFAFVDSLVTGMKAMYSSASEVEIEDGDKVESLSDKEIGISFVIAMCLAVFLFIFLPNFISNLIFPIKDLSNKTMYNLTEGIIKMVLFLGYVLLISRMEEIKKTFRYHGAEHKSIMCYESGKKLTVENVRKSTRFHPRCGTSFILIVFIISLIVGYFIYIPVLWQRVISKILLLPIISGIAYEFIIYSNKKDNFITKILKAPGLLMQRLTTKEPTDEEIEVGIASLLESMEEKEYIKLEEMVSEYTKKYKVSSNDLYRIIGKRLDMTKDDVYIKLKDIYVSYLDYINIKYMLERYCIAKEPLQYILGSQEFYGLSFKVGKGVLVPRADTEILVEESIKIINDKNYKTALDMCTGSGCIGISIAKNSNIDKVIMVDISETAIKVCNDNIKENEVKRKCKVIKSNLFKELKSKKVDIIVSNPPYIKTWDINKLDEVVKNEPRLALDGGDDGLEFYRQIAKDAIKHLNENGTLIFEIGYDQAKDVTKILENFKEYSEIRILKDYGNNDRVVICNYKNV